MVPEMQGKLSDINAINGMTDSILLIQTPLQKCQSNH